jgi:putative transposase
METYKRGSHTVWDCKYHLVWVTKYRYAVLGGDVGQRCRELLRETTRAHEMIVHAGSINRDHVHMLVSIPPNLSISRAVQHLKGRSSHKLLSEVRDIAQALLGPAPVGERGYWVATSGNVTDEMWVEYIKNQTPPEPDDNFNVT